MSDAASPVVLLQSYLIAIAAVPLGIASLNDLATRTIPDLASLGLLVVGVAVRLTDGTAVAALAASAAVLLLGALCWRFGWLGGGDVKLLAACAWLVSPALVPQLVLLTALAGGVLACLYLALSWMARASRGPLPAAHPRSLAGRIWRAERWRIRRRAALPYGCAIAVGTLLTLSGW
ncbi:MAG TPA: A24 family peptidase [Acetobacteraceae bacterium]|nr:A24 family peptidase [Acetobacteraceae bacterium]